MARTVFFHVGAPKTGTTYLQAVLAKNTAVLEHQGLRYAAGTYPSDSVHASELARGRRHRDFPRARGAWDRILAQVAEWDGDVVISHEFFGACTEQQARRVQRDLAPARVHVVLTARDYVRQVPAVWQERLKYGHGDSLAEFSLDPANGTPMWSWQTQDVPAVLRRWSADLPAEQVHVVTVPPAGGPPGLLWQRFATVLGVDPQSCDTTVSFANSSLGLVEAEVLRRVDNRLPDHLVGKRLSAFYVRNILANDILARRRGERFGPPAERVEELRRASAGVAEAVASAGYDVVGDLADLVPTGTATTRTADDVADAELLEVALDTVAQLVTAMERRERRSGKDRQRRRGGPGVPAGRPPSPWSRARRLARRTACAVRGRVLAGRRAGRSR